VLTEYLELYNRHKIRIEIGQFLQGAVASECEVFLQNNLNFLDHLTCSAAGKFIEIIFSPAQEITDEYLFQVITGTIKDAGLSFVGAILSIYVGNNTKRFVGAALGALFGLKFGPVGSATGAAVGAGLSKLFDWKNLCECVDNGYGQLSIQYLGDGTKW